MILHYLVIMRALFTVSFLTPYVKLKGKAARKRNKENMTYKEIFKNMFVCVWPRRGKEHRS